MTKEMRALLQSSIGIVIVALTLVIFFVNLNNLGKLSIDYWALSFLLSSEITFFAGILFVSLRRDSENKLFINIGIITTVTLYMIATFVCSLISRSWFGVENIGKFIVVNVVIIGMAVVCIITIIIIGANISDHNKQRKENMTCIKDVEMMITEIKYIFSTIENEDEIANIEVLINSLNEELFYSDPVSNVSVEVIDKNISNKAKELNELTKEITKEKFDDTIFCERLNEIIHLIKTRNKVLAQSK